MELISSIQQRIFISAMDLFRRKLILHLYYTYATATGKVNVPVSIIIACHKTCVCAFCVEFCSDYENIAGDEQHTFIQIPFSVRKDNHIM